MSTLRAKVVALLRRGSHTEKGLADKTGAPLSEVREVVRELLKKHTIRAFTVQHASGEDAFVVTAKKRGKSRARRRSNPSRKWTAKVESVLVPGQGTAYVVRMHRERDYGPTEYKTKNFGANSRAAETYADAVNSGRAENPSRRAKPKLKPKRKAKKSKKASSPKKRKKKRAKKKTAKKKAAPRRRNPGPEVVFEPFNSWADVLLFASNGGHLWYQAPMDTRPRSVRVVRVYKNGTIRLDPMSRDADPFTADKGHLSRMRRRAGDRKENPSANKKRAAKKTNKRGKSRGKKGR